MLLLHGCQCKCGAGCSALGCWGQGRTRQPSDEWRRETGGERQGCRRSSRELRSELVQFGALAMAGIAKVLQVMQRCAGRRLSDAGALPMRQDVSAGA